MSASIERLKSTTRPGACIVCQSGLDGRHRVLCGAGQCRTVYNLYVRIDRARAALVSTTAAAIEARRQRELV